MIKDPPETWNRRSKIGKFFRIFDSPILIFIPIMVINLNEGQITYKEFLLLIVFSVFIVRTANFYNMHLDRQLVQRNWSFVVAGVIIEVIAMTWIIDHLYRLGHLTFLKPDNYVISNSTNTQSGFEYLILVLVYISTFFIGNAFGSVLKFIAPDSKEFFLKSKSSAIVVTFVFLLLLITSVFSFAYYFGYILSNQSGFNNLQSSYGQFFIYSYATLINSPITEMKPTSNWAAIATAFESLCSFVFLVLFLGYLISKYSPNAQAIKNKQSQSFKKAKTRGPNKAG